ncbi:MAG: hypothetical protein R6X10_14730 [Desulfobacterales bacterium]
MENNKGSFTLMKAIVAVILGIVSLFGIFQGAVTFLEGKVQKLAADEKFIKTLANRIRPTAMFEFNWEGKLSILYDAGAMQHIEEIKVKVLNEPLKITNQLNQLKLIVTPKKHLSYPPLIQSIDDSDFSIEIKRGQNFDWEYTFVASDGIFVDDEFKPEEDPKKS